MRSPVWLTSFHSVSRMLLRPHRPRATSPASKSRLPDRIQQHPSRASQAILRCWAVWLCNRPGFSSPSQRDSRRSNPWVFRASYPSLPGIRGAYCPSLPATVKDRAWEMFLRCPGSQRECRPCRLYRRGLASYNRNQPGAQGSGGISMHLLPTSPVSTRYRDK